MPAVGSDLEPMGVQGVEEQSGQSFGRVEGDGETGADVIEEAGVAWSSGPGLRVNV